MPIFNARNELTQAFKLGSLGPITLITIKNEVFMKSILMTAALLLSVSGFAETAEFTVEGVHCAGCSKLITKKVCDDPSVKAFAESCEVKLVDTKKQIGAIHIVSKADSKVDSEAIKKQLKAAGEDYKITSETVK